MSNRVKVSFGTSVAALLLGATTLPLHAQTLIPRTTERPTFDCTKARAPIELLICADAELAQWDGRLGQAYNSKARQLGIDDRKALLQEQRQWAAFRRMECGIPSSLSNPDDAAELKPCIIRVTKERIEALGGGLATAMQDTGFPQARVVKTRTTIAVAQADAEPKVAQGGAGYEAALRALASKLILQLQSAGQKSATVLDFTDLQGQGTELGRFLAQELSDQLVAGAKTLSLVDRANLQYLLRENKLSMEGLVDPKSTRKLGNMIGIDTVIMGTVTPLGNSVRLSVRAVAVETGKIVAAQSITVPAVGGLGEMYTRGVATASPDLSNPAGSPEPRPTHTIRDQLRADSFKFVVDALNVGAKPMGYGERPGASMTFRIENHSGIGIGLAAQVGGFSSGPCVPQVLTTWDYSRGQQTEVVRYRSGGDTGVFGGVPSLDSFRIKKLESESDPTKELRWFPPNAKVSGTIRFDNEECNLAMFAGAKTTSVAVTFVLAAGKEVVVLPLSADNVPVRVIGQRQ